MRDEILQFLQSHRLLAVILLAFLTLGITYSVATPVFEAGDELWHYPFVHYLAAGHGLPVQDPNVETLWEQEGGQPPLYYALGALTTFWIDTRDLSDRLWRNPHAKIGIPLAFGNKNMVVHTSAEDLPWQNTTLAVHLIRFLSIALSAGTVALTYFLALEIKPNAKTLAAIVAAIVAFNPMFIFISASVNNDNLAVMLATLALWLLTRLVTRGATLRRFAVLGIVLGLGALTKISNLGLFGVAAVAFAYLLWREWKNGRRVKSESAEPDRVRLPLSVAAVHSHWRLLVGCSLCAAIVIALAFWWYMRNWMLYGDPLAFNVWVAIAGGRPTPVTLVSLLDEFQGFRISFWGNFGGVNLIAPEWIYAILDLFTLLAVIGLLIGLVRRTLPWLLVLPALWLGLISISLVRWTWLTLASQGRLIFPAISAVALLLAYGLAQFSIAGRRLQSASGGLPIAFSRILNLRFRSFDLSLVPWSFVIFLFAFSLLAPFTLIAPAYALPMRFSSDRGTPNPLHITFDNQAELVGYNLPQKAVKPGGELPLTLYWRAREPILEDFSVYVRLFDADGNIVGRWDAFPGGGLYPTRLWQPGEVIEDQYRVPIALEAQGPGVGRVEVGLFRRVPLENLTARDPQGRVVTPTVARFKIEGQSRGQVENPVEYNFGQEIALVGYSGERVAAPGSTLRWRLYWRARATMTEDYTVFVHLVDANGKIIAQKDNQPQEGAYPTSFWDVGEIIADEYTLAISRDTLPGDYGISVGIYRASDGVRLPVQGSDHMIIASVRVAQ